MTLLDGVGTESVTAEFVVEPGRLVHELRLPNGVHRSSVPLEAPGEDPRGDWWKAHLQGLVPEYEGGAAEELSVMELFCGPGGLALGFDAAARQLGYEPRSRVAVDQDVEALEVYRANHRTERTSSKSVAMLVDYHVRGAKERARFHYTPELIEPGWEHLVGNVDVILAGPPCQGHSNLNNHSRRVDPRNELYLTVPAMALAVDAPVVVIENVPAVVHDRLGVVAATTALLRDAGYQVSTGVLDAARLGWAQRRSRFFLVARKDRAPIELPTVAEALHDDARPLWWAIGELEDGPDEGFMTEQADFSEENQRRIDWLHDNDEHDLALAERPECHQDGTTYTSVYGRLHSDRPAPTITTGFMTPGRGRYVHPTRRRVITAREAARLQGFPDTYRFQTDPANPPARSKLAKWIGDAVPMPLGHAATISALGAGPIERTTP